MVHALGDCSVRQVEGSYLLANRMKANPPTDPAAFRAMLCRERRSLAAAPAHEIDETIRSKDQDRFRRFTRGRWEFALIELDACMVWPEMGGRKWASGRVDQVASAFQKRRDPSDEKVWEMISAITLTLFDLPLIVVRRSDHPFRYSIEDGCHRSVAYHLAGFRVTPAFVGTIPSELNHAWAWPN